MEFLKTTFAKLNADNYHLWKYKLELVLRKEGLWNLVNNAVPSVPDDAWKRKNEEATVIIGLSVEDNQLMLIKKAKSAHESWIILRNYHEKDTLGSSVRIMKQICRMKYSPDTTITDHIMNMKLLFEKLEAVGESFSERWWVAMLLSSLPSSYDTLVMNLL